MGPLRIRRAGDPPQEQRKQRAEGYALYEEKPNLRRKGKCVAALHRPVQAPLCCVEVSPAITFETSETAEKCGCLPRQVDRGGAQRNASAAHRHRRHRRSFAPCHCGWNLHFVDALRFFFFGRSRVFAFRCHSVRQDAAGGNVGCGSWSDAEYGKACVQWGS